MHTARSAPTRLRLPAHIVISYIKHAYEYDSVCCRALHSFMCVQSQFTDSPRQLSPLSALLQHHSHMHNTHNPIPKYIYLYVRVYPCTNIKQIRGNVIEMFIVYYIKAK